MAANPEIELVADETATATANTVATTMQIITEKNNASSEKLTLPIIIAHRIIESTDSVLTNFHAGYFRISLALAGQALLWKTLVGRRVLAKLHPSVDIVIVLWSLALLTLVLLSLVYILKILFHFNMVKAEFLHHVGVNYLFVPWISCLLLLQSAPFLLPHTAPYLALWWIFAVPVVALDVKIYGQWFTKGKQLLSAVANPTSQMSVIGNLVGAHAAANTGSRECAVFLFALGMVHYLVLFVTLYQRLSGNDQLPTMLRPVFFLFFAAPSVASLAWEAISGGFDITSKIFFFLSLFLFTSLACRPALFKRAMTRFNVAWWAYSFPLTVLALASAEYSQEVGGAFSHILMLVLLVISVLAILTLIIFTIFNTRMMLPDKDPIASLLINRCLPTALAT